MIGQKIGVDALMPYALALLASNPLTEGHFYPGDLLTVVMRQPPGYWATHPGEATAVRRIATAAKDTISSNQCDTDFLLGDIDAFLALTERHA